MQTVLDMKKVIYGYLQIILHYQNVLWERD